MVISLTYFIYSSDNYDRIQFLIYSNTNTFKYTKKRPKICIENIFKNGPYTNYLSFLNLKFKNIISGNESDLKWLNFCFSIYFNLEALLLENTYVFDLFLANFFICHSCVNYVTDSSLTDHSITVEKNLIDFSVDLFGFCKNMRNQPAESSSVTDCVSKIYRDTINIIQFKNRLREETFSLIYSACKKNSYTNGIHFIFGSNFDINSKLSKINFLQFTDVFKGFFVLKNSIPIHTFIDFKGFFEYRNLNINSSKKLNCLYHLIENLSRFYWQCSFFETEHRFVHMIFIWIVNSFVFGRTKIGVKQHLNILKHLIFILNAGLFSKCISNLVKITRLKKNSIDSLHFTRIHYLIIFLTLNFQEYIFPKPSLLIKNTRISSLKCCSNFIREHFLFEKRNLKSFSLKNPKFFSMIDFLKKLIWKATLYPKFEEEVYFLILKFTGFDKIVSLCMYILAGLRKKILFSYTIELIKSKVQYFQSITKTKAYRFIIIKILMKSDIKRIKISRTSLIENLISFRLVNINYFPRVIFEKLLIEDHSDDLFGELTNFFLNRITNWKNSTRTDNHFLKEFLQMSKKKEQKLAIKTLFKVKKTKKLFGNGMLSFCCNYLEASSFFISRKMYETLSCSYLNIGKFTLKIDLNKIFYLKFLYNLYLRRTLSCI